MSGEVGKEVLVVFLLSRDKVRHSFEGGASSFEIRRYSSYGLGLFFVYRGFKFKSGLNRA